MKAGNYTIFIKPNGISSSNAVLAINYWGGSSGWIVINNKTTPLVASNVYTVSIPDNATGMKFVRHDPNSSNYDTYNLEWNESNSDITSISNNTYYNLFFMDTSGWNDNTHKNISYNSVAIPSTVALNGTFLSDTWADVDLTWTGTSEFIYTATLDLSTVYQRNPKFKLKYGTDYFGYSGDKYMTISANGWVADDNSNDHNCVLNNSATIYKTYTATATWLPNSGMGVNNSWTLSISGLAVKTFPATISTSGYGTFSNASFALDFSSFSTNFTAHTITAASVGNTVTASAALNNVPANTGILLQGTAGSYDVPVIASSSTDVSSNLLKPGTGELVAQRVGNDAATKYNYILTKNAGGTTKDMKFYLVNDAGNTVPVGKAYLQIGYGDAGLPQDPSSSAPPFFNIDFGGETTDVSEKVIVNSEKFATAPVYNLNGQRVANPTKGLYIVNGRKVAIK